MVYWDFSCWDIPDLTARVREDGMRNRNSRGGGILGIAPQIPVRKGMRGCSPGSERDPIILPWECWEMLDPEQVGGGRAAGLALESGGNGISGLPMQRDEGCHSRASMKQLAGNFLRS